MNPRSSWIPRASNTRGGEGGMPSGSASGRPTSGLSKPRLAKVRRRPTPRTEAPGMRAVEVKLGSWYPFDDSSWIPSGESARSGDGNGSEEGVKSFVFGSSRSFPESRGGMSGGETAGSGVSVFGRSAETRKTANLHRRFKDSRCGLGSEKAKGVVDSSSFSIGEGLGASLPDRMRRLDVGKTSQQQGGVRDDKLNVDGSNIKFSCGGDSNVFGQSMASKLPENMRKLNINSSTDEFRFSEATKDDAFKTNIAREHANHFGFNSEARNSNLKTPSNIFALKKLQRPDGIVFGSSKDATYSLDEDIESKLPVKIKRLNIANEQKKNQEDGKLDLEAGNLFSETSTRKTDVSAQNVPRDIPQSKSENIPDTILNTKVPASGTSIFVESDPFVFSSGKNRPDSDSRSEMHTHIKDILSSSGKDTTYSLDEDIANKLPVKMKRLNIENEQKKNQEDGKLDLKAGNLFSETSSRKTDISAQKVPCGIHRSTSESIPDTILNAKVPATGTSTFVKSDPFVFSSGKNKPDSDSRSEMHTHNIMDTLSSSGNNNWSVRGLDNSSITDNSTFPKFKFQTNEQDRSTGTGVGCSIDSDYHFVLNETGSSLLPSVDPGMPPVATDFTFTSVAKECKIPNKDASFFGKTDPFVFTSSKNVSSSDRRCEMHTFVEDTLPNSFNDSQSVREQDKSSTTDNSTFPDFKFQTNEQDRNAEIDIDCSINSDYHFVTNETDSFHPSSVDPGLPSVAADFTFTSVAKECKIPIKDASFFSQEHIFSEKHSNLIFNSKKGFLKDSRSIKRREKLEKFFQDYQNTPTDSVHRDKSPKDNLGAYSSGYSPMDFSPYEEVLVADTRSRPSVSLDDSVPHVSSLCSGSKQQSNSVDDMENLVSAAQYLVINETNVNSKEPDIDTEKDDAECFLDANTSFAEEEDDGEEVVSKPGQVDSGSAAEGVTMYYSSNNESAETKFSPLCSTTNESAFRFASEAPTQASFSSSKIFHRRKDHKKMVQKSHKSTLSTKFNIESTFPSSSLSNVPVQTSPTWTHGSEDLFKFEKNTEENKVEPNKKPEFKQKHVASTPESIAVQEVCEHCSSEDLFKFENNTQENMVEPKKKPEFKQEHAASTPESIAVREVCEKWRLRGNQAYENGHLSKAEEYYTRGVNCASSKKHSRGCTHELKLCYSNRAATRMSLGRLREALNDCMLAAAIDPNFLKAHVRAANCHLALGETEAASKLYKKCFEILSNDGSGSKILEEASNGLQTAQNVADCISRSAELLRKRACDDVNNALEIISEALLISPHSEYLIEMKAEALFSLKRYEEVIELCEKTMESSEINSSLFCADGTQKMEEVECKRFLPCKVWRWCLICRSYFYLGSLEEALSLVQKHQLMGSISNKCGNKSLEFFSSFSVTAKELLRLKSAGNDAFQAGRHLDAVEHYTAALMCSIESRPFAAICFCNRAAAYHGLGQVTDAIADCSLAIALDASYPKAISRRATLYELIRDYDQAASDLGRLISLMEKRTKQKSNKFGAVGGSTNDWDILKQARLRLASIEEEARKGISLNMYTILGIESSSSAADIKKAYRKAALKHHPDKASQLLVKGENGDDAVWKDVCKEVHMDADRLFKMIGEAYTVLSDPSKRRQYDAEEEKRAIRRKGNDMARRDSDDAHYSRFDRGSNNRYSEYSWSIHGNPHRKYSDYSYYSRY